MISKEANAVHSALLEAGLETPMRPQSSLNDDQKKQRIADNTEAPKQMRITAEETIQPVDFSAGSNERESLQMTPKCFKSQSYLKVDRGSTGRKWGYLKASSESKKHLISLFNTGTTGPMPLVNSLEKDHNID